VTEHARSFAAPGLAALVLLAVASCAHEAPFDYAALAHQPRFEVGPGDVLEVRVYQQPELTTKVRVRPDGSISLPLIGDVAVGGHTTEEIQVDLGKRYQRTIADADRTLSVFLIDVTSYRVSVVGQVHHAGVFNGTRFVSVLEALALAGGPNEFARTKEIFVLRQQSDGKQVKIPIDYEEVAQGRRLEMNVVLRNGDTVVVP
jgi:polysaccharide export outer membrane protein